MSFTKNYGLFKIPSNRTVSEFHVRSLVEANKKSFLLDCYPIIVNQEFELFDGQHRLEACKRLDSPVWYTVKEGLIVNHESLLQINSHTRTHSLADKIEIALSYKDIEVLKVERLWRLEPRIPITIVCELVGSWSNSSLTKKSLSNRTFMAKHEQRFVEFLEYLNNLEYDCPSKYKGTFVHSMAHFWHKFPQLREEMNLKIRDVGKCTTRSEYRESFLRLIGNKL